MLSKSNYNDDIHKLKMINVLRDDLELEKQEILDFLCVSESSYNKMVSSSNRKLPQKSIDMLQKLFFNNDWDEIIKDLHDKKDYVLKIIKVNRFHVQKNEKFINCKKNPQEEISKMIKNMYFISSFVENENIQEISDDDLEILSDFAKTARFAKNMNSYIRMIKFKKSGDRSYLQKEDYAYIGLIESLYYHDDLEEVMYQKGLKKANLMEEKIKTEIDLFQ